MFRLLLRWLAWLPYTFMLVVCLLAGLTGGGWGLLGFWCAGLGVAAGLAWCDRFIVRRASALTLREQKSAFQAYLDLNLQAEYEPSSEGDRQELSPLLQRVADFPPQDESAFQRSHQLIRDRMMGAFQLPNEIYPLVDRIELTPQQTELLRNLIIQRVETIAANLGQRNNRLVRQSPQPSNHFFPNTCKACQNYSGNPYLECAIRPTGLDQNETCSDCLPFDFNLDHS